MKNKYLIDKGFIFKLIIYIGLSLFIIFLLLVASFAYSYFLGINIDQIPEDACSGTESGVNNAFYCFLLTARGGHFYYFFRYTSLILIIFSILALIVLNVVYIINRFFFKRLVLETSYGAVIYKYENNKTYFLLLNMSYGHISLCKGHVEKDETPRETALREIKEETNLDVQLNTDFQAKITYSPYPETIKNVTFFLAEANDNQLTKDEHDSEVTSSYWTTFNNAIKDITYDSDREVIKKAYRYMVANKLIKNKSTSMKWCA